jgi:hypothetical protein
VQNLVQEALGALVLEVLEEVLGGAHLDYPASSMKTTRSATRKSPKNLLIPWNSMMLIVYVRPFRRRPVPPAVRG